MRQRWQLAAEEAAVALRAPQRLSRLRSSLATAVVRALVLALLPLPASTAPLCVLPPAAQRRGYAVDAGCPASEAPRSAAACAPICDYADWFVGAAAVACPAGNATHPGEFELSGCRRLACPAQCGAWSQVAAAPAGAELAAVVFDRRAGRVYAADAARHVVLSLDPSLAPSAALEPLWGEAGAVGNVGGAARLSRLSGPRGLEVHSVGRVLYVADTGNGQVRALDLFALTVLPAAATGLNSPRALALHPDSSGLYVAEAGRVLRVAVDATTGHLSGGSPVAVLGASLSSGSAGLAVLRTTSATAASYEHWLFVADESAGKIQRVSLDTGAVDTVVGASGTSATPGTAAGVELSVSQLGSPRGLALWPVEGEPTLMIADIAHGRVYALEVPLSASSCQALRWSTETAVPGAPDSHRVCGRSRANPGTVDDLCDKNITAGICCSGRVSWHRARDFCERQGARLCSQAELEDDEAKEGKDDPLACMTGDSWYDFHYDDALVWTSTPCRAARYGHDGYLVRAGARQWSTHVPTQCASPTEAAAFTRCCADAALVLPVAGVTSVGGLSAAAGAVSSPPRALVQDLRFVPGQTAALAMDPVRKRLFVAAGTQLGAVFWTSPETTIAGTATKGHTGEAVPAHRSALDTPLGLAWDEVHGKLFIADRLNNGVRSVLVGVSNRIDAVAGSGSAEDSGDGGAGLLAGVWEPAGVEVDASGSVLYVSTEGNAVRRVDLVTGTISTTINAAGVAGLRGDSGPAELAELSSPKGLSLAPGGSGATAARLAVADRDNHRVRVVDLTSGEAISTVAGPTYVAAAATRSRSGLAIYSLSADPRLTPHLPPRDLLAAAPAGFAASAAGDVIFIADEHTQALVRLVRGTGSGSHRTVWPVQGVHGGGLMDPAAMLLLANGSLVVCDRTLHSIFVLEVTCATGPLDVNVPVGGCHASPARLLTGALERGDADVFRRRWTTSTTTTATTSTTATSTTTTLVPCVGYLLGDGGASCSQACAAYNASCDPAVAVDFEYDEFAMAAFGATRMHCQRDARSWWGDFMPGIETDEESRNYGWCLGTYNMPAAIRCDGRQLMYGRYSTTLRRWCKCRRSEACNRTTTLAPPTSPPPPRRFCDAGVPVAHAAGEICCANSCGTCGGERCGFRPGGEKLCCISTILQSKRLCQLPTEVGCIVPGHTLAEIDMNSWDCGTRCPSGEGRCCWANDCNSLCRESDEFRDRCAGQELDVGNATCTLFARSPVPEPGISPFYEPCPEGYAETDRRVAGASAFSRAPVQQATLAACAVLCEVEPTCQALTFDGEGDWCQLHVVGFQWAPLDPDAAPRPHDVVCMRNVSRAAVPDLSLEVSMADYLALDGALNEPAAPVMDEGRQLLYFCDSGNDKVKVVDMTSRRVLTVAGRGPDATHYDGDGGPARDAALWNPRGLALDAARGLLYIADTNNHVIRRITFAAGRLTGIIHTIAGINVAGPAGDGGSLLRARLNYPWGLALDGDLLYVSDSANGRIRSLNMATDVVTLLAGNPEAVDSGDGASGLLADVYYPRDLVFTRFHGSGEVLFAEVERERLRALDLVSGIIETALGTYAINLSAGAGLVGVVPRDYDSDAAFPYGVALSNDLQHLYIASYAHHWVRRVDLGDDYLATTLAGRRGEAGSTGDGGPAVAARLQGPTDVLLDERDTIKRLYIAESDAGRVRVVNLNDGLISTAALFPGTRIFGLALDANSGNLFVSSPSAHKVYMVALNVQPCSAPGGVANVPATGASCREGTEVRGSLCTPVCSRGYVANERRLHCFSGILTPPTFACLPLPCNVRRSSAWAAGVPCVEGWQVPSGGTCTATCKPGYAASANLSCMAGALIPSAFDCLPTSLSGGGGGSATAAGGSGGGSSGGSSSASGASSTGGGGASSSALVVAGDLFDGSLISSGAVGGPLPEAPDRSGPPLLSSVAFDVATHGLSIEEASLLVGTEAVWSPLRRALAEVLSVPLADVSILGLAVDDAAGRRRLSDDGDEAGADVPPSSVAVYRCHAHYSVIGAPAWVVERTQILRAATASSDAAPTALVAGLVAALDAGGLGRAMASAAANRGARCPMLLGVVGAPVVPCQEQPDAQSLGTRCTGRCLKPLKPSLEALTCFAGLWSPPRFSCLENVTSNASGCQAPDAIEGAAALPCAELLPGGPGAIADRCTPLCRGGLVPDVQVLRCEEGQFVPPSFGCVPAVCNTPVGVTDAAGPHACREGGQVPFGFDCTATCRTGFQPTVPRLRCTVGGSWSPAAFACEPSTPADNVQDIWAQPEEPQRQWTAAPTPAPSTEQDNSSAAADAGADGTGAASNSDSSLNLGFVIGLAATSGLVVLAAGGASVAFVVRRRRRKQTTEDEDFTMTFDIDKAEETEKHIDPARTDDDDAEKVANALEATILDVARRAASEAAASLGTTAINGEGNVDGAEGGAEAAQDAGADADADLTARARLEAAVKAVEAAPAPAKGEALSKQQQFGVESAAKEVAPPTPGLDVVSLLRVAQKAAADAEAKVAVARDATFEALDLELAASAEDSAGAPPCASSSAGLAPHGPAAQLRAQAATAAAARRHKRAEDEDLASESGARGGRRRPQPRASS